MSLNLFGVAHGVIDHLDGFPVKGGVIDPVDDLLEPGILFIGLQAQVKCLLHIVEYPVTRGHTLIMPRRHTPDFFTMTKQERSDSEALVLQMKNKIMENDLSVTGFNIGVTNFDGYKVYKESDMKALCGAEGRI